MRTPCLAIIAIVAALLAGCAGPAKREAAEPLATLLIAKNTTTLGGDCMVNVSITNQVRDTPWDGVSYHVSLLNSKGVTAGRLMGVPRKPVPYGRTLSDSGRVLGVRCEDIAGAELVYLGYYPVGKPQVNLHNSQVRVGVK